MKKYTLTRIETKAIAGTIDYTALLDEEQLAVVLAGEGAKLVIAGAGSGKTRAVTYRVARLVESGVPPQTIMLLTFTNKAAREMLRRVEALLPNRAQGIWGGTFHHIGNRILRRFGERVRLSPDYTILDAADVRDMMKLALSEIDIPKDKRFPRVETIVRLLSLAINTGRSLEEIIVEFEPRLVEFTEYIIEAARQYTMRKLEMNCVDFDDMLLYWRVLLYEKRDIAEILRNQFRYILVDEYQDTNKLQGDVIDGMALEHRNITAVGDDSQSIYSFRGADFSNIVDFPKRYPDAQVFYLTTNYRSTPEILNLANESIKHNRRQFKKTLRAIREGGVPPILVPAKDVYEQAAFIAQHILRLNEDGVPLNKIAVLYRSHADSIEVQVELTKRRIPYLVRSGVRFFETAHIKDVVAFLRIYFNPLDELSFSRSAQLFPGVGANTAAKLWAQIKGANDPLNTLAKGDLHVPPRAREGFEQFAAVIGAMLRLGEECKPDRLIATIMEMFYESHLPHKFDDHNSRKLDIEQLMAFSAHFGGLKDFLSELSLLQTIASEDVTTSETATDEFLVLSSIHQAKGLEWKIVFLVNCADGRLPLERTLNKEGALEEERRLFYVALTRTQDELYITYPLMREERQRAIILRRSRFIDEIPVIEKITDQWQLESEESQNLIVGRAPVKGYLSDLPIEELDEFGERIRDGRPTTGEENGE
ncbi:MAG: ATP-dependent helicase [Myxococcota bacterium]